MSHLSFKAYSPNGLYKANTFGYMQSVKVENTVYISGQGGWNNTDPETFPEGGVLAEIDQAFLNIATALEEAGATFENVFKVVSYHIPLSPESLGRVVENFAKHMPNHKPLWTCVEVPRLGDPGMHIEIEVIAHIPK